MRRPTIPAASAALLLAVSLTLPGCASASRDPDVGTVRAEGVGMRLVGIPDATALPDVVASTRQMGAALLDLAGRESNTVVSPASLAVNLAMLAEGARGESLADLDVSLGAAGEARRDAFAALQRAVLDLDGDPAAATADMLPDRPIVHLANRVVADDGIEVDPEYLEALADGFEAGGRYTDLESDGARTVLSEWIHHHTGGLIKRSAIEPRDGLRLVLQDVVLFAARWQTPFPSEGTRDAPFTLADGSTVEVETMHSTGAEVAHVQVEGWHALRLPYADSLHADLLLPPEGVDPADAAPDRLAELSRALDEASPEPTDVSVPTVDVSPPTLDLIATRALDALGLDSVLCTAPAPDLSGIALRPGELCLDQAAQQAVLTVDEEGTVAAAVTELGAAETSMSMSAREVRFDRPFLFTVTHSETDWPLFFAAVRDPRH